MRQSTLPRISLLALVGTLLLVLPLGASAQNMTACDWEVAHPSDPDHVGPGRSSSEVDTVKAIAACRDALENSPGNPRFHYQLARALVYHAGRTQGSDDEGMQHLAKAAAAGYTQAMFVYGLMLDQHGETCAIEPWTRKAADEGLKAARIAYVDYVLKGTWAACEISANFDEMKSYLEGASSQVSGYYEKMLLAAFQRELTATQSAGN